MTTLRKYRTNADPSPFMGVIKAMSFHAENMGLPVVRLQQVTPYGKVTLMRAAGIEFVDIIPKVIVGRWEMVFNLPYSLLPWASVAAVSFTLHFELKRMETVGSEQTEVRYYFDVPSFPTIASTYPVYKYLEEGGPESTTMYVQVDDIANTSENEQSPWAMSGSFTIWDNHSPLTESGSPAEVTNMEFVCNYSFSWGGEERVSDYFPVNGYVVETTYKNWQEFVANGWLATNKKYTTDITMVKYTGDWQTSITLDYLNNDYTNPTMAYDPSGETDTVLAPLTSIKDDYDYSGDILPYINKYTGWASASILNSPDTLAENYIHYETTDPPSDYLWQDIYDGSVWPWLPFHAGLFKENGAYSEPCPPYYYSFPTIGHTTPYEYETSKSSITYSKDNSFIGNVFISGNPTQFISYDGTMSPDLGNIWSIWRRNTTSGIVWQYSNGVLFSAIQLPAKNATKLNSKLGIAKSIPYELVI